MSQEIPFNAIAATLIFFCYYYPVGLYNNATPTDAVALRGVQFWLFTQQFLLFTSTFTHMMISWCESVETGELSMRSGDTSSRRD